MADLVVAEIRKNSREVLRVTLDEYNGRPIASLRVWLPGR